MHKCLNWRSYFFKWVLNWSRFFEIVNMETKEQIDWPFPKQELLLGESEKIKVLISYSYEGKSFSVETEAFSIKNALIFFVKHYEFDSIEGYTPK